MSSKAAATVKKSAEVRRAPAKAPEPVVELAPVEQQSVAPEVKTPAAKARGKAAEVAPVVAPAVVVAEAKPVAKASVTAKASPKAAVTAKPAPAVVKAAVVAKPVEVAQEEEDGEAENTSPEVNVNGKVQVKPKKKRQRPKIRSFAEIYESIYDDIDTGYKRLQLAHRALKSLESAHNREVHNTKSRESSARTPTIVFDQEIINYFRQRLNVDELVVRHKEGGEDSKVSVSLSELSTDTRVHRTDVTQLYNLVFKKHNMQDPEDGRFIMYQNDPDLVNLLTTGSYDPKLEEEVEQLRQGTFRLTIFNIQRFTNHHLGRVELPPKAKKEEVQPSVEATAE